MNNKTEGIIRIAVTSLLAVAAFIFWAFPYRAALSYHEQFQLFLTDSGYFTGMISCPGGLAAYVGEYLVQFYNNYWLGAMVLALLLTSVQLLTARLAWSIGGRRLTPGQYALTFLPVALLWLYLGDSNVLLAYVVAFVAALLVAWAFTAVRGITGQRIFALVAIPAFYWLFGPAVAMLALLMCVKLLTGRKLLMLGVLVYTVAVVIVFSMLVPYPIAYQLSGIGYYRVTVEIPLLQYGVMLVCVLSVWLCSLPKARLLATGGSALVVAVVTVVAVSLSFRLFYNPKTYELIDYDYLVRTNNWAAIIHKAERSTPDLPMSVCATNLALAMTGQLGDRAFEFGQHGPEGLLPVFRKEPNSSLMTGEAYFQLGMINTAQRFTFEAMEAIPNYNKSTRCLKRLAETNIIRGDYAVARKYLHLLERTAFYRKWARRMLAMIDQPGAVDSHPLYGRLRRAMIDDDFLYSDIELDKTMGRLYLRDSGNAVAKQYLMMYPLLERDLDKFMQYMQVIRQSDPAYNPPVARQAAMLAYVKAGREVPQGLADPPTMQRFRDFALVLTQQGKDSPALDDYRNTAWYYLVKGTGDEK